MSDSLPGGAKIPVTFVAGQPLTENELNALQRELLQLILTHSHAGNDLALPQGEPITQDGIAKDAVHSSHIAGNAITRGHISQGAVGGSEIGQQQVAQEHLKDGTVVTRTIEKGNVTLEKLSDEVQVLLKAPREGATTYGYCVWLDGRIGFPGTANWFDWLLKPTPAVRVHDLPILRKRDDGGWQPIDVILPPEQLRPRIGKIVLSEPGAMTDEIVTVKATEAGGVHRTSGKTRTPQETAAEPLAATAAPGPLAAKAAPDTTVPRVDIAIDEVVERNRVAMEVNPQDIGWDVGVQGRAVFHPGIGSNLVFSDVKEPVTFQPDREPSDRELQMIDRILYHFDIADVSPHTLLGVDKAKIYDFLNNPHLLPAGYWTGATRNVRSVTRMRGGMGPVVRVSFSVPYLVADYVVNVTPEHSGTAVVGLIPLVMARTTAFVDIAFVSTQNVADNRVNFSVTIYGELAKS